MSLGDLPPELVASIISFLIEAGKHNYQTHPTPFYQPNTTKLAPFALISRTWQAAVERRLFSSLEIASDDLAKFEEYVTPAHARRCAALSIIKFTAILPAYDDVACARFERDADKQANNEAFTAAMAKLFSVLHACEPVALKDSRPISLSLEKVYSPMDGIHRATYKEDKWAEGIMQRRDLFEHRYERSYLRLLDTDSWPDLKRVTDLGVHPDWERIVEPSVATMLAAKLPNLETIDWQISDRERKYPKLRVAMRADFGSRLQLLQLDSLRNFTLEYKHEPPQNHHFINTDVRTLDSDGGDIMCTGLHRFIHNHDLKHIVIGGPICLDPTFFWPLNASRDSIVWPNLESMFITLSQVGPAGEWYFERDPNDSDSDSGYPFDYLSDDDDYETDESEFNRNSNQPDEYDHRRGDRLDGVFWNARYRYIPNQAMEELFEAMAKAVSCAPRIKHIVVEVTDPRMEVYNAAGTLLDHLFDFEYAARGVSTWLDQLPDVVDKDILHWTVPRGWRMGSELESLWKRILGKDGIIRYEEWTSSPSV